MHGDHPVEIEDAMVRAGPRQAASYRRWLAFGLATSAVLHALILLAPLGPPASMGRDARQQLAPAADAAVRLLDIRVVQSGTPPPGVIRNSPRAADQDLPDVTPPTAALAETPAEPAAASGPPAHVRLRPAEVRPDPRAAAIEAASARIAADLRPFTDSLAEVESRGRLTDWSTPNGNGGRWGVSPGAVHLGSVTISPCKILLDPFSCQFRAPDAIRGEARARADMHREIRIQAARAEVEQAIRQRIRDMDRRREAARDTTGGR
jgi:hypothetical protein